MNRFCMKATYVFAALSVLAAGRVAARAQESPGPAKKAEPKGPQSVYSYLRTLGDRFDCFFTLEEAWGTSGGTYGCDYSYPFQRRRKKGTGCRMI